MKNYLISYQGKTQTLTEWANEIGIPFKTLLRRLYKKWTDERILETPYHGNKKITAFGETKSIKEWIDDCRCVIKDANIIRSRLNRYKWSVEDSLTIPLIIFEPKKYEGKCYGKVLVIKVYRKNSRYFALCKCLICNKIFKCRLDALTNNGQISCGCDQYKSNEKNKLWKGFGEISSTQFARIKTGARYRNQKGRVLIFDITIEYIWNLFLKQNRKCCLSGVELNFSTKAKLHDGNASLDRIDSSKGYVEGNVQWVHKDVNMMKQGMKDDEFIKWCETIYFYKKNSTNDTGGDL